MSNIKDLVLLIKQLKKIGVIKKKRRRRNKYSKKSNSKEGNRQDTPLVPAFSVSNPQQFKNNNVQESLNRDELVRIAKELHDSKTNNIKKIEDVNNRFTDFHDKAKNAFGILLDDNNHFRNKLDYYENQQSQQPHRFNHDTITIDPSIIKYKVDDDEGYYNPDVSFVKNMGNTHEELQSQLNNQNVGFSTNDGIDVEETSGDLRNSTQHSSHEPNYATQALDFTGRVLDLASQYITPIKAKELEYKPDTITPSRTHGKVMGIVEEYEKRKQGQLSNKPDDRKQGQSKTQPQSPSPQPQSPPQKSQSPPQPPHRLEYENEDEEKNEDNKSIPIGKRMTVANNLRDFYSVVLGGSYSDVSNITSIPLIRKECLKLVRLKYSEITKDTGLFNINVYKSTTPENIHDEILKVNKKLEEKRINEEKKKKKSRRDKAIKDFS
jgi:hypothetical protein